MPRPTTLIAAFAIGGVLAAAVACTDRNPAAPGIVTRPPPPEALVALRCTAQVRDGAIACSTAPTPRGARGVILGGQGVNVRLASSGTVYDAGTETLTTHVTVENLTGQVLGSRDGVNAAAEGVRVFFQSGPTVTKGTGPVTVANPDGQGTFTAGLQPYFRYAGGLVPGDTTAPREWRFSVPGTAAAFEFTVYVAAPVALEAGWVSVTPIAPSLAVGDTQRMEGVLHAVTGRAAAGPQVRWWSSNPAVATVDDGGLVTALAEGTAVITATSGARVGTAELQVSADPKLTRPTLVSLEVTPGTALAEVDTVTFRVGLRNPHSEFYSMTINVGSALNSDAWFCSGGVTLVSGTAEDGVYQCKMVMPGWMIRGVWEVESVELHNVWRDRKVTAAGLRAAGAPWRIEVKNPGDEEAPVLDSLSIPQPAAVSNFGTPAVINVSVTDPAGIAQVRVTARSERTGVRMGCQIGQPNLSGTSGTYPCHLNFLAYMPTGAWVIEQVSVQDVRGNARSFSTANLQALGYPTAITVTGAAEDIVAPVVTGFAVSSATVAGNTADSVSLSVSATDERSGLRSATITLARTGSTQTRPCSVFFLPFNTLTGTQRCALRFNATETGTWTVRTVTLVDAVGNVTSLDTGALAAAGYPTAVTVTP
ncbi:MAG TPA: Ig-like domain-containing protein [Longimicrobium sp.]|jgi:hypothetical protein